MLNDSSWCYDTSFLNSTNNSCCTPRALPSGAFIYLSPFLQGIKPPLCKGRWLPAGQTEGLSFSTHYNPPVSFADSPLYTRGPFPVPTIILQITLLVSVKDRRLYCRERKTPLPFPADNAHRCPIRSPKARHLS